YRRGDCPHLGLGIVPGISLSNRVASHFPITTTRNPREKLDLGSRKLNQAFSTARRIYQLSISPCTQPDKTPDQLLICRHLEIATRLYISEKFGPPENL